MDGKITFNDIQALADFLKAFVGCTAKFEVVNVGSTWVLTFTGGF